MASFILSEVFIVERMISSGHLDLDDLPCEATVCTSEHQAYCVAIKNMIKYALDKNCDNDEEESLRIELVKTMRRRGINVERRYRRLKDLLIGASRAFNAEKTYYNVRQSVINHEEVDEQSMIQESLMFLGAAENGGASGSSASRERPAPRDPSLRGRGRVLPPLAANQEGLARKRARDDAPCSAEGSWFEGDNEAAHTSD